MFGNVVSRILGLVREQVIAILFGASGLTSAFVAALTVPTMIYDLLIGGAISAALIPVFSDYAEQEDKDELWRVASIILNFALLILGIATVSMIVLAPQLVWLLAIGLDQATQAEALRLIRIVLPSVIFLGLSGVTTAILYARQMFIYPAFCVAAFNLGVIVLAVALAPMFGIAALAIGVLAGAILQIILQLPGLRGFRFSFSLNLRHPGVKRIVSLYGPVALGLIISQIGVIIDRNLASRTGEESMAVMRFATTLVQFPLGLVATATAFAILPTLSRFSTAAQMSVNGIIVTERREALISQNSTGDSSLDSYKETLVFGMKLALLAILPATIGLVMLRLPLIRLLFEHGAFNAEGTRLTALAFLCYAPQLPFVAIDQLLIFAFYARKNTLTPMLVGLLGVIVYLVAGLSLIGPLGMPGLVLANTLQNSLHAVVLFALLWRIVAGLKGYGLTSTVLKSGLAALCMPVVYYPLAPALGRLANPQTIGGQIEYVVLAIAMGVLTYLVAIWLLRVEEARLFWRALRSRLLGLA